MLLDMGFVDDEAALRARLPSSCCSAEHSYQPQESGQEGDDFYEIDLGDPAE